MAWLPRSVIPSAARADDDGQRDPPPQQGDLGTSRGVNIAPGSDDDGWIVPEPVRLDDGTRIQLYKDGEALHAAYEAIRIARRRIYLEIYIFSPDETGQAFTELLCRKAQDGLAVYVLYDSLGSLASRHLFERMRRSGIYLQEFHPIRPWEVNTSWRPVLRDHRKLLVIDDHVGGLGGLNIGAEYAGSWVVQSERNIQEVWRDTAVGMVGPSVRVLSDSFERAWRYCTRGGPIRRAQLIHNLEQGDFGLLASVPTRSSPLRPLLHRLLREARRSIQMTIAYFAPSDALVEELCRAARRGVRVQLMLPGVSDIHLLVVAARSFYETLLAHGIEIYERQGAVLHAKTIVIDGFTSVVGSANVDYRSIEYNLEISAIVRSEQFGRQMQDLFDHDVQFATRILPEAWRHRPMWDRFMQWAVMRARYLL